MDENFFWEYNVISIIIRCILLFYRKLAIIWCVDREHLVRTSGRPGVDFMYI